MAVRKIRMFSDELLHKDCKEVEQVSAHVRALLEDMADTLRATSGGMGLAAPQIGVLKRLVVVNRGERTLKLVNPVIIGCSGVQDVVEGCLSFPGRAGRVIRPFRVTVEAKNEFGRRFLMTADGEMAKCLCHEIDHLNGIVYTDRAYAVFLC